MAFKHITMKVAIWDTYVSRNDGTLMHFDIIVPASLKDEAMIFQFGKEYLKTKGEQDRPLAATQCQFCHVEAVRPQWADDIVNNGYYIYEMEGC